MKTIDPLTHRWGGLPISAHPVQSLSESLDWLPRFTKVPVSKFGFEENLHRVFVVSVDEDISEAWGKLAAARLWSIATTGRDAVFAPPFAALPASHRKVKPTIEVPGSPPESHTLYDVAQAASWIASRRTSFEEGQWMQQQIEPLLARLN